MAHANPELDRGPAVGVASGPSRRVAVVGVGASAGGIEALEPFLRRLPPSPGFSLVIAQHLAPHAPSRMVDVLGRMTTWPVVQVDEATPVAPNVVYLLPRGRELVLAGDLLRPTEPIRDRAPATPINTLFHSIAASRGEDAAVVVLSGAGSDGAEGAAAVAEVGGLVLVQRRETARFDGMPSSAVAAVRGARALDPGDLADALLAWSHAERGPPRDEDAAIDVIATRFEQQHGIPPDRYERAFWRETVAEVADEAAVLVPPVADRVEDDSALLDRLRDRLEQRSVPPWLSAPIVDRLETQLRPTLSLGRAEDSELRAWIPGFTDSLEVLVVAGLLLEVCDHEGAERPLKVFATQADGRPGRRTWASSFSVDELAAVPPALVDTYFVPEVEGQRWRVGGLLRGCILASRLDPFRDPPPMRLDVLVLPLRMSTLAPTARARMAAALHFALREEGRLLLVHDDATPNDLPGFVREESSRGVWLRRSRRPSRSIAPRAPVLVQSLSATAAPPYRALVDRWVPSGVLLDGHDHLIHVFGDAGRIIELPVGPVGELLQDNIVPALRATFAHVVASARQEPGITHVGSGSIRSAAGPEPAELDAEALVGAAGVVFVRVRFPLSEGSRSEPSASELADLRAMLRRLSTERDGLQAELAARTTELEAANEELVNANEELNRSNDELIVVNEELRVSAEERAERIRVLDQLSADLQNFLDATPVATLFADGQGRMRLANPLCERLLGLAPTVRGSAMAALDPGLVGPGLAAAVARALQEGESAEDSVELSSGRVMLRAVRPYRGSRGDRLGAVVTFVDVTALAESRARERAMAADQRRLEAKLQEAARLESLGVLAGGVAHDFNNILTGVLANVVLAELDPRMPAESRELLADIHHAARRARELCMQMLAYSGRGHLNLVRMDPAWLVHDTLALATASIPKRIELVLDLAPKLPETEADSAQLRQVLMNLLINAAEAIGERPGRITIRLRLEDALRPDERFFVAVPTSEEGPFVSLEVEDSGPGISGDNLKRIFEPFFTTKFAGRGLGLAATQGIVRGHQAGLSVRTAPGEGTCFRLLLRAFPGPVAAATRPRISRDATRGQSSGRILVVDDEVPVRAAITRILRRAGYESVQAEDGREAVRLFARDPATFTAVALDLTMPVMDGIDTFTALRSLSPTVPVMLMSGYSETDASASFGSQAPKVFLQKPFAVDDFLSALESAISAGP